MPVAAAVRPSSSSSPTRPAQASQHNREQRMDNNVPVSQDTTRHRSRRRRKRENWVPASASGNLLYRPLLSAERLSEEKAPPALPSPRIAPRRTRPHSIQIVSLPPGYVPRELRIKPPSVRSSTHAHAATKPKPRLAFLPRCFGSDLPLRLLFSRIIDSLSGKPLSAADLATTLSPASLQALALSDDDHPPRPPSSSTARHRSNSLHQHHQHHQNHQNHQHHQHPRRQHTAERGHSDRPSHPRNRQSRRDSRDLERRDRAKERDKSRENSRKRNKLRDPSRDPDRDQNGPKRRASDRAKDKDKDKDKGKDRGRHNRQPPSPTSQPPPDHRHQQQQQHLPHNSHHQQQQQQQDQRQHQNQQQHHHHNQHQQHPQQQHQYHHHHHQHPHTPMAHHSYPPIVNGTSLAGRTLPSPRHSIASVHQVKFPTANVTEIHTPVATGSGVSCSIILAERHLFLSGFDHDGRGRPDCQAGTALLRGRLQLNISKSVKIKAIQLKLVGRARTEWPEGIPPLKQDVFEEESLRTQVLTFFSVLNGDWETEYGNQCTYRYASDLTNPTAASLKRSGAHLTREMRATSLRHVRARSVGKGDARSFMLPSKGHKVFPPGTYDYGFELPIDHHQLETTKVPYASVRWELHATVDRAGAFKPNLHGVKELPIIRLPDQLSLEMTEPISIRRSWEDQLYYDIIVSGKSFPIGSKIPIAFKLTPLAKVRVHKIKVFVSEVIEYWTNDRRVTRKDPGRKVLLLEKSAGKELDAMWDRSELTTLRGGELTAQQRLEHREQALRRNTLDAFRNNAAHVEPVPPQPENLLGDLELGLENLWGATELEANVQIPTCEMMAKDKDLKLHPTCSWRNVRVLHWIKVVMRISRLDTDDVTNTRRRHFEITIDSPLNILDCRATQANTILPTYSQPTSRPGMIQHACGCFDAPVVQVGATTTTTTTPTPNSSAGELLLPAGAQTTGREGEVGVGVGGEGLPRPIHLLRAPSFNPPAFDDDVPPPVLVDNDNLHLVNTNAAADNADLHLVNTNAADIATPPPHYDAVVGTPSVDGLADYFSRLAEWRPYREEDSEEDEGEGGVGVPRRLTERTGRVNVAHPRGAGGQRFGSRSLELARPLGDMGVGGGHVRGGVRRGG